MRQKKITLGTVEITELINLKNQNKTRHFPALLPFTEGCKMDIYSAIICNSVGRIFERTIFDRLKNYFGGQKYDNRQLVLFLNWRGKCPTWTEKINGSCTEEALVLHSFQIWRTEHVNKMLNNSYWLSWWTPRFPSLSDYVLQSARRRLFFLLLP